jgi:Arc/MetJ family transcription regulator
MAMRTTVLIEDELIEEARELTGLSKNSPIINRALKELVQRENQERIRALTGSVPEITPVPRRRITPIWED